MADRETFAVDERRDQNVIVLRLAATKIPTFEYASRLGEELHDFVDTHQPARLLISLARLAYCSSEIVAALIGTRARMLANGGLLKLCGLSDEVREIYRTLKLDGTVFGIYDTEEEALKSFAS